MDLERLIRPQPEDVHMNMTGEEEEGDATLSGAGKGQVGIRSKPDKRLAHLDFRASVGVGEDAVAGAERQVGDGLAPGIDAGGFDRNGSGDKGEPGRAWDFVALRAGWGGGERQNGGGSSSQQQFRHREAGF